MMNVMPNMVALARWPPACPLAEKRPNPNRCIARIAASIAGIGHQCVMSCHTLVIVRTYFNVDDTALEPVTGVARVTRRGGCVR
jgi:hypothetical protein